MNCWMLREPVVAVVYAYPVFGGEHDAYANRFAASYAAYFPELPHHLWVVSNGGNPHATMQKTFANLPHQFIVHDDSGWEIGAYLSVAKRIHCDMMVCFGGSTLLVRKGWLERMVESFIRHGPAVYGATANTGYAPHRIFPHIRTTAFWLPPELLRCYPYPVTSERSSRFEFEHGPHNLTVFSCSGGLRAWQVTWDSETEWPNWANVPNGFQQGDQSQVLVMDRMCEPPFYPK